MQTRLRALQARLDGELHFDALHRHIYATDASIFREMPLAVAFPQHKADVRALVQFAAEHGLSLIPRAAGTSLAGQCVGPGIVVDVSKYMNKILEINPEERRVRVQPGVIRDELNLALKPYGLFFGPSTSTANRCMLGGMVGNNSCGVTSIVYGATRDHVLELEVLLSDGAEARFKACSKTEFAEKQAGNTLEAQLYRQINAILSDPNNQTEIRREFPKPAIQRRNTGYAIDLLL
ncbi:MAG: FAD-binding oxidoreductase, partial [Saprospiraceae bacterium]